ncbi:MAG TPA: arylesterase [Woeseiaceae bacterium]|nr:arylesterase [Woeseiaceae bacterium]
MRYLLSLLTLLGAAAMAEPPTVLVFGDSLSSGYGMDVDRSWPALLQERLVEQGYEHRVVNASITGETTEGGAARIDDALSRFAPALVILELGGNDGLRGFPPARIKDNLRTIIEKSRARGAGVVLLGIRIPPNYGPRYTRAFEDVYRELAAELDVPWVEFFMQDVALDEALMQDDRIHPNEQAQEVLLENAWPAIKAALESLQVSGRSAQ